MEGVLNVDCMWNWRGVSFLISSLSLGFPALKSKRTKCMEGLCCVAAMRAKIVLLLISPLALK